MIDRDHELSITRQARLLNISRGTVYYLPQPVSPADLALMRKIDELHLEHPFMGARMLRDQVAGKVSVQDAPTSGTLMYRMGMEALAPQPGTSKAAPGHTIYPYLLRQLAIARANQVWALDTTTSRWRGASSTSPPWWTSPAARCWHTRWRSRWTPATPER